jgi:hypothetical protein
MSPPARWFCGQRIRQRSDLSPVGYHPGYHPRRRASDQARFRSTPSSSAWIQTRDLTIMSTARHRNAGYAGRCPARKPLKTEGGRSEGDLRSCSDFCALVDHWLDHAPDQLATVRRLYPGLPGCRAPGLRDDRPPWGPLTTCTRLRERVLGQPPLPDLVPCGRAGVAMLTRVARPTCCAPQTSPNTKPNGPVPRSPPRSRAQSPPTPWPIPPLSEPSAAAPALGANTPQSYSRCCMPTDAEQLNLCDAARHRRTPTPRVNGLQPG